MFRTAGPTAIVNMRVIATLRRGAAVSALVATIGVAQGTHPASDDEARWWRHVTVLADDALEGRQTGSEGYRKAAAYKSFSFREGGPEAGRLRVSFRT